MPDWFPRFGDIPGVNFPGIPGIERETLPGHNDRPELLVYEFDGKRRESLSWTTKDGSTSASPVHQRAFGDRRDTSTPELLRSVYQGLELPGEPGDYHFLIQGSATELWSRRRQEPDALDDLEKLCWLDIQLIQARPDAVTDDYSDERKFYSVPTFSLLIELYEREGFLKEALEVAELAARYGQGEESGQSLRERIAALESEDSA